MPDLSEKAAAIRAKRSAIYPPWKETAHRYHEGHPCRYPADMIRAKLARDPDCRREDTRVDIVNYLAMLDELDEPKLDNPLPWWCRYEVRFGETVPETINRLKREKSG